MLPYRAMAAVRELRYLIVLGLFAAHTLTYVAKTQDDTYITLRYARNLASGAGLVYNSGERVEGYSNFLYTIILSGLIRLGADPLLAAKAIGLASGCLAIVVCWKTAALLPGARRLPWLAPLLLAVSPAFAAWAVLGLETVLFSLLILLAVQNVIRDASPAPRLSLVGGGLFALIAMCRPEGALFLVITAIFLAAHGERRRLVSTLLAFGLPFGAFLVWRMWYYGDILPNTYYAKTGMGLMGNIRGAKYVFEFFRSYGGAALPFLAVVPLFWGAPSRGVQYVAWQTAAYLTFVVWVGGDNFSDFRFIVPVLPLLYLLATDGVVRTAGELRDSPPARSARRVAPVAVLVLLTAVFALSSTVYQHVPAFKNVAVDAPLTDSDQLVTLGEWLRGIAPAKSSIAVGEAGAIPWVTGWRTLDAFGLSDREIARVPRVRDARGILKKSPDAVIKRVLGWQPDFVEFYAVPGFDTVLGPNDNLLWKALLTSGYRLIPPYDRIGGFVVFARPDIAVHIVPSASR